MKRIAMQIETSELCSYGCGQVAKFINGSKKLMCSEHSNSCPENRKKNSERLKLRYQDGTRVLGREKYNTLSDDAKSRMAWSKGKRVKDVLFIRCEVTRHKQVLIEERGHVCECCGNSEWIGKPITLELEHIDGDNRNNIRENLKLLCPNCHSQTDTWRGRNIKLKPLDITDEQFIDALKTSRSIRQALIKLNLTPKAGNYARAYNLMNMC